MLRISTLVAVATLIATTGLSVSAAPAAIVCSYNDRMFLQ